jgi:hypothetical protein
VPSSTDVRIEALCERFRALCHRPIARESEEESLAHELRTAIDEHVRLAKSSLNTKHAAIIARDQETEDSAA